jgi:hypothetical protein
VIIFFVLFALLVVAGFTVLGIAWFFRKLTTSWPGWTWGKRIGFAGTGIAVIAAPYLAFKVVEHRSLLARVPAPLHVARIEYRVEEAWGIGLPGDNETGLVVYRLTRESARWARDEGRRLPQSLRGTNEWRPTPVDVWADGGFRWHLRGRKNRIATPAADISQYLSKYGFPIPLEPSRINEVNRAIRTSGSFYSYGRGGTLTIVDPTWGKVYFVYAG